MDSNIMIVATSLDDVQGYHRCISTVAEEKRYLAMTEAPLLDAVLEYIEESIKNGYPHFVAKINNQIIGWSNIVPRKHGCLEHCGDFGIGVEKKYRNTGIGTRLAKVTIDKGRQLGIERLEVEVFSQNKETIRFYKKLGFEIEGIKRKARKHKGAYDDIVMMGLLID